MQACFAECQKINPSGWGISLPGAVVEPPVLPKSNPINGSGRSELQILVDNVVRDLPSFDKHTSLLVSYMDKHPQEVGKMEEYLKTQAVTAAQDLFTLRSRFEAMKTGRGSGMIPTSLADSPVASVLQARDINADSFSSEAAIPVPATLNETKAKLGVAASAQKKRRTIDPATHTELRSRLAGIGADTHLWLVMFYDISAATRIYCVPSVT
ncbi:hypothetical protein OESDEN_02823 [Oesophagostomum dentatum]|uniref:Uncharacterized protein n=1 Tax=Oesophagostomum dentatum TaxID=61180 RepID=A0A0B1TN18_OESDE|nr:hypothetical protein OESDEN_02823 [Oesophagostomum dentatum]